MAALAAVIPTPNRLFSQPPPTSLCIVDTKPDQAGSYDPPAGPFAIGMYQQLAGQRLRNKAQLNIIVLPASLQRDIVPEVQRLHCSWVLQLWYYQHQDNDVFRESEPRGVPFDRLVFTLSNGATRKIVESGGGLISLRGPVLTPYESFRKQILAALNQQH
ncbi:hypothetical protein [Occallatibacter riparius]|uniref:Uncharacterized protein n=1 Tax=Occallatibacter riparius TaxID=1002689 RepID=A0A9J7BWQ8_9BACT|nr:hypothetical protein [Occallatibacter riparius]UWZ86921.1 hypothetical protein MOP44_13455 [Occallatibacter riparius]